VSEVLAHAEHDESVIVKGWLSKSKTKTNQKGALLVRKKRRWCVLHHDGIHYYEQPFGEELGSFLLFMRGFFSSFSFVSFRSRLF
jgi:hypothetical protein